MFFSKIDDLFGKFLKSNVGKFIFRKKSYLSVMSTLMVIGIPQLALLNSQNYLIDFVQRWIDSTEGFWHYVFIVISLFVPEGNVGIIVLLALVGFAVTLIRYRELLPFKLKKLFNLERLKQYAIEPIGREKDRKAIKGLFENNKLLILINSMGGIGKSVLAQYYYDKEKENYKYIGFVVAEDRLKENFLKSLAGQLPLSATTTDEQFVEAIGLLGKQKGNKLLIVDDVKNVHTQKESIEKVMGLADHGFHILFTSREHMEGVETYELKALETKDAIKLFSRHCPEAEGNQIVQILDHISRHTLFIELIASTVHENSYTLDDIINRFENGTLVKMTLVNQENGNTETFNRNLKELFDMQNLDKSFIEILQRMTLFPSIEIDLETIERFFKVENLKVKLGFLVKKSWLFVNKENEYKLHEIIKLYLLKNHFPSYETIANPYSEIQKWAEESNPSDSVIKKYRYISYFDSFSSVLNEFKLSDKASGTFYGNIGTLHFYLNIYSTALKYLTKSLAIRKEIGDKAGEGTTLNNMGHIAWQVNDEKKALQYWLESHQIAKDIGYAQLLDAHDNMAKQLAPALGMEYAEGFWDEVAKRDQ